MPDNDLIIEMINARADRQDEKSDDILRELQAQRAANEERFQAHDKAIGSLKASRAMQRKLLGFGGTVMGAAVTIFPDAFARWITHFMDGRH